MIRMELEKEGVDVHLANENSNIDLPQYNRIEVLVREEDEELAKDNIKNMDLHPEEDRKMDQGVSYTSFFLVCLVVTIGFLLIALLL